MTLAGSPPGRRRAGDLLPLRERCLRGRSLLLGAGEAQRVDPQLALRGGREAGVAEQPLVVLQEREHLLVLLHRAQVARQLRAQVWHPTATGPSPARPTRTGRTHPSLGLSGSDLHLGDRAHGAAPKRCRSCLSFGHRSDHCTSGRRDVLTNSLDSLSQALSPEQRKPPCGGDARELRDRDSNPNFRNQNPASYH